MLRTKVIACESIKSVSSIELYLAAVASAFDDTLHYHPTLVHIIGSRFGCKTFPSPSYKMAYVSDKTMKNSWRWKGIGALLSDTN